jgi:hypothetical protein
MHDRLARQPAGPENDPVERAPTRPRITCAGCSCLVEHGVVVRPCDRHACSCDSLPTNPPVGGRISVGFGVLIVIVRPVA